MNEAEFLSRDYEIKVNYLNAHFSRMWTRFNFFLTIETALIAFSFSEDSAEYTSYMAVIGLIISLAWFAYASQRYLATQLMPAMTRHGGDMGTGSRDVLYLPFGSHTRTVLEDNECQVVLPCPSNALL